MKLYTAITSILAAIVLPFFVIAQDLQPDSLNAVRNARPLSISAQELTPDSLNAVLNARVLNETGKVSAGDTVTFTSAKTGQVYSGVTDDSGRFSILVPNGCIYAAGYRDMNGQMQSSNIELPGNQLIVINWELVFEMPRVYTLDNVFFDTGKATLRPKSYVELDELVEVMLFKKNLVIEIGGHTDDVGEDDDNMKLSQSRAASVRDYLIKNGVNELHVKAKGYGESRHIAYNTTPEGRQKNRRTEVKILSRGN